MALPCVPERHRLAVEQATLAECQPEQHQPGCVGKADFVESPEA